MTPLLEHAAAAYPHEACGLVVRRAGGLAVVPGHNLAPRGAFELDPATLISHRHEDLVALYHSHCDAPPILSAADRATLVIGDQPAWPGVEVWIVPVRNGVTAPPVRYGWNSGDFSMISGT